MPRRPPSARGTTARPPPSLPWPRGARLPLRPRPAPTAAGPLPSGGRSGPSCFCLRSRTAAPGSGPRAAGTERGVVPALCYVPHGGDAPAGDPASGGAAAGRTRGAGSLCFSGSAAGAGDGQRRGGSRGDSPRQAPAPSPQPLGAPRTSASRPARTTRRQDVLSHQKPLPGQPEITHSGNESPPTP